MINKAIGRVMGRVIGRVECVFGLHHRSRGQARDEGSIVVSACRHCGIAMVRSRNAGNKWTVKRD